MPEPSQSNTPRRGIDATPPDAPVATPSQTLHDALTSEGMPPAQAASQRETVDAAGGDQVDDSVEEGNAEPDASPDKLAAIQNELAELRKEMAANKKGEGARDAAFARDAYISKMFSDFPRLDLLRRLVPATSDERLLQKAANDAAGAIFDAARSLVNSGDISIDAQGKAGRRQIGGRDPGGSPPRVTPPANTELVKTSPTRALAADLPSRSPRSS